MPSTACIVIIGNEILSGRTQDAHIRFIAHRLADAGIALEEVRIIPDKAPKIIETITLCRAQFDHVFTTGGIGPTHDDITSACVAEAVGVSLICHPETYAALEQHFGKEAFNKARQRMAMLPSGAIPITNPLSIAPGFTIANVHVMAGVPKIMQAMFDCVLERLEKQTPLSSISWHADLREGVLAEGLESIQRAYSHLDVGSYPFERADGRKGVTLVVKGYDAQRVREASEKIKAFIISLGALPLSGEPDP